MASIDSALRAARAHGLAHDASGLPAGSAALGLGHDEGVAYRRIDEYLGEMAVPMKSLQQQAADADHSTGRSAPTSMPLPTPVSRPLMLEDADLPPITVRARPNGATPAPTRRSRSSSACEPCAGHAPRFVPVHASAGASRIGSDSRPLSTSQEHHDRHPHSPVDRRSSSAARSSACSSSSEPSPSSPAWPSAATAALPKAVPPPARGPRLSCRPTPRRPARRRCSDDHVRQPRRGVRRPVRRVRSDPQQLRRRDLRRNSS